MRVKYYDQKLQNSAALPSFYGFVPRWYIPHISLNVEKVEYPVVLTIIIADTKKENYVDIGWDWPPMILDKNEIML